MINHVRTLLCNRPPAYYADVADAVYIPQDFNALSIPGILGQLRDIVVPAGLDRPSELSVLRSIVQLISAPELLPYCLMLDGRTTYRTDQDDAVTTSVMMSSYSRSDACDVIPSYTLYPERYPAELGNAGQHVWTITPADRAHVKIQHDRGTTETLYCLSAGTPQKSKVMTLMSGYCAFYFELPSQELTGTFCLTYRLTVAPQYDIAARAAELNRALGVGQSAILFAPGRTHTAVVQELQTIWLSSQELPLRFGAAVLALAFQLDELMNARG